MNTNSSNDPVVVLGWGAVAPGASNVAALKKLVSEGKSALATADLGALGQDVFVVGDPVFDEQRLKTWLAGRSNDARAAQWLARSGDCVKYTVAACAEALATHARLEETLVAMDSRVRVILGTGLTDLRAAFGAREALSRAGREWNQFWAHPERNAELAQYLQQLQHKGDGAKGGGEDGVPPDYRSMEVDSLARHDAMLRWNEYWARRSHLRAEFEKRVRAIESTPVGEDLERGPLRAIASRQRALRALTEEFHAPTPPWESVDPQLLWSIPNAPAAELTMLLGLHGPAFAPAGACAAFGLSVALACESIRAGDCDAAIVGACDPRPLPEVVAAFHRARLTPACGTRNDPFTDLRGTHVAGGACVWIIGRQSLFQSYGITAMGPKIVGTGVSSDAEHMITPSEDGPRRAIAAAIAQAGATPESIGLWDLHASGTPGDARELLHAKHFAGEQTVFTARKGQFGHGMGVAGGWELTMMALSLMQGRAFATGIDEARIHRAIAERAQGALVTTEREFTGKHAVKVSLGVGGITSCVVLEKS